MSTQTLNCYIVPSFPTSLMLPVECVAEVGGKPEIEALENAPAKWMQGHVNWRNQRLPVISFDSLLDSDLDQSDKSNPILVVLNPIPNAARKAYSGMLCHGDVQKVTVEPDMEFGDSPSGGDRRYVEAVIKVGESDFVVPRLTALGVAFSYF